MKTVLVLASLVVLTRAWKDQTKSVDTVFVQRQRKLLSLVKHIQQWREDEEFYRIGKDYNITANINNYTNKKAVEGFLALYEFGLMPKGKPFSVFYDTMREEAVALFRMFYYAKDFDTFYKTAAWARVYVNEGQFLYTYYIAVKLRTDTADFVLPPVYEVYPQININTETVNKMARVKMQNGIQHPDLASQYGAVKENENYIFYYNYSNYLTYSNEDQKLSYFTEDIGLNSYYQFFHSRMPFWMEGSYFGILNERRGEIVYNKYRRILSRYSMERSVNGLDKIPEFSWIKPFKTGYKPLMTSYYPFAQRTDNYQINKEENFENLRFLEAYENKFLEFLEDGNFKAYNQEIKLNDSRAINFVGNYWQSNIDLYEKTLPRNYRRSYQSTARRLLGAAPQVYEKSTFLPSALDFYQTSLRDPAFYQLYNRINKYILEFKQYLKPYTRNQLQYVCARIKNVKVDPLVTYFDYFDIDYTNGIYLNSQEYKSFASRYIVRQPRLNHKPFTVTVDVKADLDASVIVKIFLGPKYDNNGYPIILENSWMDFLELDWFTYKLVKGDNKIERKSGQFMYFDEDLTTLELEKLLSQNKIPKYKPLADIPDRLMLPKGTKVGSPFQLFVMVYPSETVAPEYAALGFQDMRPLGYPFDRPAYPISFNQSNMYFQDILIYHEGEEYAYKYNIPGYVSVGNEGSKKW